MTVQRVFVKGDPSNDKSDTYSDRTAFGSSHDTFRQLLVVDPLRTARIIPFSISYQLTTLPNLSRFPVTSWNDGKAKTTCPTAFAHTLAADPHYYGFDPPLFLSMLENGDPVSVAFRTPPRRVFLSTFDTGTETAMAHLVRFILENEAHVPGVVGPENEARCFSEHWLMELLGCSATISTRLSVFEAEASSKCLLLLAGFDL